MSTVPSHDRLQLPESLRAQLLAFRRRVWSIKMVESVAAAAFGLVAAWLVMFAVDRLVETPAWARGLLFVAAWVGTARLPLAVYRWVWRNHRLDELARLLSHKYPLIGDQLLGIIELVRDDSEQARSRALCEAAVAQVAEDARRRDFRDGVPHPRHRLWLGILAVPAAICLGLLAACPQALSNSLARLMAPWKATPRYTFAAVEPLPPTLVVAHGEPFPVVARLRDNTAWKPAQGAVQLGEQHPVSAAIKDDAYAFELPSQIDAGSLDVRIGDYAQKVRIEPTLRPELTSVSAEITLPDYLGRSGSQTKDVRGGVATIVKGARASFTAVASRDLSAAQVDGQGRDPNGASVSSPPVRVDGNRSIEFRWKDALGLEGRAPFVLSVNGRDDEAPSLACENLPRQKVVLDSETLNFRVKAQDDFGVKTVGMEWNGPDDPMIKNPAKGERILAAGGSDKETLDVAGTFTAKNLGIDPQPVAVRVFVEDYLPGRPRVYSAPYILYVLNAEQHAIWLTEQLSKWQRQSIEVRDREMQLLETNKQLRAMSADELDRPDTRKRIEAQADAERANGRRLTSLVGTGEDLVQQAMRNPEFGVGHLEKWAEMLQVLKDISGNRMPTVADLLKQASRAQTASNQAQPKDGKTAMAGMVRDTKSGNPAETKGEPKKGSAPAVPVVADRESSQQPFDNKAPKPQPPKNPSSPRLTLPMTTIASPGKTPDSPPSPAAPKVDEAIKQQEDLLAEFEKVADELNRVLANLEGSTLMKRLKAASRKQYSIAGRMIDVTPNSFGLFAPQGKGKDDVAKTIDELSKQEAKGSQDVSTIMDDMNAFFERRRFVKVKSVLDEMRKLDVVGNLRQLGDDLKKENGLSIAQCEYWSDTLDRWSDDLVDPACCGSCPGGKTPASLPPSVVLEVLQVLEGEINLREDTRVAEQARPALKAEEFRKRGAGLSTNQGGLRERIDKVVVRIGELPNGLQEFKKEIGLLNAVSEVMQDATEILAQPDTGSPAIAAETEAIELLLQSKRINPKGGGGGGATPGGGGTGKTVDSAMALLGSGVNQKELREDHGISQATGESGPVLPEEYRAGLDEYFNKLERNGAGR
ncbi:hypothetical protein [Aquisphaera insulae]|uniref:hypothetical protein n=1 Tax=Aquisphaera insulae TaxID=2712864 RepID=UPI0013EC28FE|nr:hypothetical protein [Aquisphaera insulae]